MSFYVLNLMPILPHCFLYDIEYDICKELELSLMMMHILIDTHVDFHYIMSILVNRFRERRGGGLYYYIIIFV